MTPLSAIFVDASEASRKGYKVEKLAKGEKHSHAVWLRGDPAYQFFGTRAKCECWVAVKAKDAGVAAVRKAYDADPRSHVTPEKEVAWLFEQLAGGE